MWGLSGIKDNDTEYYHHDGHGNVTAVTDENGAVLKSYEYDAFGVELNEDASDGNPFRYCGAYYDKDTGLYYLINRYYDPTLGRFTQRDPAKDGANWYIYCYNNPLSYIDPWGLIPTVMEAAEMSAHIYDYDENDSKADRTIAGWRLIDVCYGREGMKVGVYIRDTDDWQNPTEYTLAFKGTTWYDLEDWKNNAEQLFSSKSADMWDAISYSQEFTKTHAKEITFVGHSKGGAEAATSAVVTNKNAIIFNPATSNLRDYGLDSSTYSADMTAYIVKGDIVNATEGRFSKPIDNMVYLPRQHGGHWYDSPLISGIQNHLMSAVKSALMEAGY